MLQISQRPLQATAADAALFVNRAAELEKLSRAVRHRFNSLVLGERIWPHDWTPLLLFAISSQVIGQSLLVYSIGTFPPLVVGLALLTQPAISALVGWFAYRETLSVTDAIGAVAIATALVLVRLPERGLRLQAREPS